MQYPIKILQDAINEDKIEYHRIMASHTNRTLGDECKEACVRLEGRMKANENGIKVLNEFAFSELAGS